MIERLFGDSSGIRAEHLQAHVSEQLHSFWSTKAATFNQIRLASQFPRKVSTGKKMLREIGTSVEATSDMRDAANELLEGREETELAKAALRYGKELVTRTSLSANIVKFDELEGVDLDHGTMQLHRVGEFIAATRFLVRGLYGKEVADNEPLVAIAFDKAAAGIDTDFTPHAVAGLMLLTVAEIDPVIDQMEVET